MKIILRANVPTERWLFAFVSRGTSSVALRQVATGFLRSHPLPSGGAARVKRPPSGDRWLRRQVATALRSHPLPSGGSGASKASTVWRQVATATGGYRRQVATASTQAMGPRSLYPVPTSDAEIASDVHARHILHHPVNQGLRRCPLPARTPDPPKGDGRQKQGGF